MDSILSSVRASPGAFDSAVKGVFRRLLSDLLLDIGNPRFHHVRVDNAFIRKKCAGLSDEHVRTLFEALGYRIDENGRVFIFEGTTDVLMSADRLLSAIEEEIRRVRGAGAEKLDLTGIRQLRKAHDAQKGMTKNESVSADAPARARPADDAGQSVTSAAGVSPLDASVVAAVTHTLLTSGRVRNSFYERKHFAAYRMTSFRAYFCSEKCPPTGVEVHWHLFCGRNLLYAYIGHLNEDGTELIHLGPEYGYQYDSIPGSPQFRKTILFSEKLTSPEGRLTRNEHPNKPVTHCQYCGESFAKLFS